MINYQELLVHRFGSEATFRPGQHEALESLESGKNTLAVLPTGGGKSLIYQLYGLAHEGVTVIISPLLSLMQDQVASLQRQGINRVVALNSTLTKSEQQYVLTHLKNYQFLLISPEMISRPEIIGQLQLVPINLLVVDEAHCISQWGMDFRVEYSELIQVRRRLNQPLTLALTATATESTLADIHKYLFYPYEPFNQLVMSLDRPNIFYDKRYIAPQDKETALLTMIDTLPAPGIVYVHNKKEAEQIKHVLQAKSKRRVAAYHAGYSAEERYLCQQQFQHGELDTILATSAFGMGINQPNVRYVIHYHLPFSMAELIQEIGRVGRDGETAYVVAMYNDEEFQQLRYLQEMRYPNVNDFYGLLGSYMDKPDDERFTSEDPLLPLLMFYRDHYHSPKQAMGHYQRFIQQKSDELGRVIAYCEHQQCLRDYLLTIFDQKKPDNPSFCCAIDEPTFHHDKWWHDYLSYRNETDKKAERMDGWKQRLQKIFLK
ncbi:RecQ family ATP-dependent DNA helicase [Aerococcus vaginalis]